MTRRRSDQRGFTLPELLVGMTLALVAGVGAVTFVRAQSLAMQVQAGQADLNDSSRGAIEFMAREIRQAGYAPILPCPGAVGGFVGGFGIVSGGTQSLHIQYDSNEDGIIQLGAIFSEDVTYQYAAATQSVQRVVGGVATDLITDVPSDGFQFRYYDGAGAELVPGAGGLTTGPAGQTAAVVRVAIRIEPTKTPDTRTTSQARASLWTNVGIRSRESQFLCH